MTMTNDEICRDYRTAKSPTKQIQILAELNQCDKNRIKQILIDGGCKLPGNMTAPGEKRVRKPKAEVKTPICKADIQTDLCRQALEVIRKTINNIDEAYGHSASAAVAKIIGIIEMLDAIESM